MGFLKRGEKISQKFLWFFQIFLVFFSLFFFFFSPKNFIYFTKYGDHNISSHFYTKFGYIVFFPIFYSIFVQLFEGLSELYFLQLYIFGKLWMYLVSTSSNLARFEATVIKISHPEGRWWNARNYVTFSLKNLFPSNPW